ncbi:MAG: thiamine pyrophosphate-dependent enzyme [Actinobacteria bacterium]|nr:thiamine pyrophosphate-dependent enzyme [Actinomycetota bacterium]MCL5887624.1 thiamine pyrophosphate-dependent enzyme [Actinomycetota bacterium]
MPTPKDFMTSVKQTWCPGCGNYGMSEALRRALAELGWEKHEFSVVWGIGCHGNGADFLDVAGMHALHGRSLPPAAGLALTRPDLEVIVEMGDGDGYGLGLGHFVHAARRNVRLTCITHNNQIYGLTTGQASPTTDRLMQTVSTPQGVLEQPVNPIGLALAEGATFIARGFAGDIAHLTQLYIAALTHKGFALVDVFQPCVTWNKLNTFQWFKERVWRLEDRGWDTSDRTAAFDLSLSTFHALTCTPDECTVPIGIYYQQEGVPSYGDELAAASVPGYKRAESPRDINGILDAME